ncbi:MAG: regulatory protein RecX [Candidatus Omnitrophota bacterium]
MAERNVVEEGPDDADLKIKTDALRLLSFRPRSVAELRQRLKMRRYPAGAVENVIDMLTRQGLLNDEKFVKLFAQSRISTRPVAKRQLEIDLKKKGLSKELIGTALADLKDYDEKAAARELVFRRFEKMGNIPDEKKRSRIYGFLKRRGFDNDTIFSVLDGLFKDDNNG